MEKASGDATAAFVLPANPSTSEDNHYLSYPRYGQVHRETRGHHLLFSDEVGKQWVSMIFDKC
jgi:hypothetical protein